jgi:hypothetical protein
MPFGIQKSKDKWKVVNKDTGRVLGTHDSESAANKQLAAVQINYGKESVQTEGIFSSIKDMLSRRITAGDTVITDYGESVIKEIYEVPPGTKSSLAKKDGVKVDSTTMTKIKNLEVIFKLDNKQFISCDHVRSIKPKTVKLVTPPMKDSEEKEDTMNLKESNELIMSLAHKHKISVTVLEELWTQAVSKQEENAKTKEEKDKSSPKFWKGVRSNFKTLIDNLEIQEAKAIMDSRERYTQSTSQWLDQLQSGDYAAAEKTFPEIMKSKLDIMINNGKEKYLKQMSDKVNKQKEG